jgi:hypothetical protein
MVYICPEITSEIYCYLAGQDMLNMRLVFNIFMDPLDNINRRYNMPCILLELLASRYLASKLVSENLHVSNIAKYRPRHAFKYCDENMQTLHKDKNYEDMKKIISTSAKWSYRFAWIILGDPFKMGENAISTSPKYSFRYACGVLRKRFKMGECSLLQDVRYLEMYIKKVVKKPLIIDDNIYYIRYDNKKLYKSDMPNMKTHHKII